MKEKRNEASVIGGIVFFALTTGWIFVKGQGSGMGVGVNYSGGPPNEDAIMDIDIVGSPYKQGLLIPRVSLASATDQSFGPNPGNNPVSLLVYNINPSMVGGNGVGFYYWNGAQWVKLLDASSGGGGNAWLLTGNAGTNPGVNFIGTTDNQDLVIKVNNQEYIRLFTSIGGYVRIYEPGSQSGLLQVGGSSGFAQFNVGGKFGISGTGTSMRIYVDDATSNTSITFNNAGASAYLDVSFEHDVNIGGTLTKAAGSFLIDHPLDPANKFLYHSFVESPDMKNVYDGIVTLDSNGEAWVHLPDYFDTLNTDYRYQLTPIGRPAPYLHIAQEIQNNRFKIAGGEPGMKVSWQVTGIRNDPYAKARRIIPVVEKPPHLRGKFLHPELYGYPPEKGIGNIGTSEFFGESHQ